MLLTNIGTKENDNPCPSSLTHRRIPSKSGKESGVINQRSSIEVVGTNESSLLHTASSHNNSQQAIQIEAAARFAVTVSPTDTLINNESNNSHSVRKNSKTPDLSTNQDPVTTHVRLNNLINAQLQSVDRHKGVRNEMNNSQSMALTQEMANEIASNF